MSYNSYRPFLTKESLIEEFKSLELDEKDPKITETFHFCIYQNKNYPQKVENLIVCPGCDKRVCKICSFKCHINCTEQSFKTINKYNQLYTVYEIGVICQCSHNTLKENSFKSNYDTPCNIFDFFPSTYMNESFSIFEIQTGKEETINNNYSFENINQFNGLNIEINEDPLISKSSRTPKNQNKINKFKHICGFCRENCFSGYEKLKLRYIKELPEKADSKLSFFDKIQNNFMGTGAVYSRICDCSQSLKHSSITLVKKFLKEKYDMSIKIKIETITSNLLSYFNKFEEQEKFENTIQTSFQNFDLENKNTINEQDNVNFQTKIRKSKTVDSNLFNTQTNKLIDCPINDLNKEMKANLKMKKSINIDGREKFPQSIKNDINENLFKNNNKNYDKSALFHLKVLLNLLMIKNYEDSEESEGKLVKFILQKLAYDDSIFDEKENMNSLLTFINHFYYKYFFTKTFLITSLNINGISAKFRLKIEEENQYIKDQLSSKFSNIKIPLFIYINNDDEESELNKEKENKSIKKILSNNFVNSKNNFKKNDDKKKLIKKEVSKFEYDLFSVQVIKYMLENLLKYKQYSNICLDNDYQGSSNDIDYPFITYFFKKFIQTFSFKNEEISQFVNLLTKIKFSENLIKYYNFYRKDIDEIFYLCQIQYLDNCFEGSELCSLLNKPQSIFDKFYFFEKGKNFSFYFNKLFGDENFYLKKYKKIKHEKDNPYKDFIDDQLNYLNCFHYKFMIKTHIFKCLKNFTKLKEVQSPKDLYIGFDKKKSRLTIDYESNLKSKNSNLKNYQWISEDKNKEFEDNYTENIFFKGHLIKNLFKIDGQAIFFGTILKRIIKESNINIDSIDLNKKTVFLEFLFSSLKYHKFENKYKKKKYEKRDDFKIKHKNINKESIESKKTLEKNKIVNDKNENREHIINQNNFFKKKGELDISNFIKKDNENPNLPETEIIFLYKTNLKKFETELKFIFYKFFVLEFYQENKFKENEFEWEILLFIILSNEENVRFILQNIRIVDFLFQKNKVVDEGNKTKRTKSFLNYSLMNKHNNDKNFIYFTWKFFYHLYKIYIDGSEFEYLKPMIISSFINPILDSCILKMEFPEILKNMNFSLIYYFLKLMKHILILNSLESSFNHQYNLNKWETIEKINVIAQIVFDKFEFDMEKYFKSIVTFTCIFNREKNNKESELKKKLSRIFTKKNTGNIDTKDDKNKNIQNNIKLADLMENKKQTNVEPEKPNQDHLKKESKHILEEVTFDFKFKEHTKENIQYLLFDLLGNFNSTPNLNIYYQILNYNIPRFEDYFINYKEIKKQNKISTKHVFKLEIIIIKFIINFLTIKHYKFDDISILNDIDITIDEYNILSSKIHNSSQKKKDNNKILNNKDYDNQIESSGDNTIYLKNSIIKSTNQDYTNINQRQDYDSISIDIDSQINNDNICFFSKYKITKTRYKILELINIFLKYKIDDYNNVVVNPQALAKESIGMAMRDNSDLRHEKRVFYGVLFLNKFSMILKDLILKEKTKKSTLFFYKERFFEILKFFFSEDSLKTLFEIKIEPLTKQIPNKYVYFQEKFCNLFSELIKTNKLNTFYENKNKFDSLNPSFNGLDDNLIYEYLKSYLKFRNCPYSLYYWKIINFYPNYNNLIKEIEEDKFNLNNFVNEDDKIIKKSKMQILYLIKKLTALKWSDKKYNEYKNLEIPITMKYFLNFLKVLHQTNVIINKELFFKSFFNENFLKVVNLLNDFLYFSPMKFQKELHIKLETNHLKMLLRNLIKISNYIIGISEFENNVHFTSSSTIYFILMDFLILLGEGIDNGKFINIYFEDLFQDETKENNRKNENENENQDQINSNAKNNKLQKEAHKNLNICDGNQTLINENKKHLKAVNLQDKHLYKKDVKISKTVTFGSDKNLYNFMSPQEAKDTKNLYECHNFKKKNAHNFFQNKKYKRIEKKFSKHIGLNDEFILKNDFITESTDEEHDDKIYNDIFLSNQKNKYKVNYNKIFLSNKSNRDQNIRNLLDKIKEEFLIMNSEPLPLNYHMDHYPSFKNIKISSEFILKIIKEILNIFQEDYNLSNENLLYEFQNLSLLELKYFMKNFFTNTNLLYKFLHEITAMKLEIHKYTDGKFGEKLFLNKLEKSLMKLFNIFKESADNKNIENLDKIITDQFINVFKIQNNINDIIRDLFSHENIEEKLKIFSIDNKNLIFSIFNIIAKILKFLIPQFHGNSKEYEIPKNNFYLQQSAIELNKNGSNIINLIDSKNNNSIFENELFQCNNFLNEQITIEIENKESNKPIPRDYRLSLKEYFDESINNKSLSESNQFSIKYQDEKEPLVLKLENENLNEERNFSIDEKSIILKKNKNNIKGEFNDFGEESKKKKNFPINLLETDNKNINIPKKKFGPNFKKSQIFFNDQNPSIINKDKILLKNKEINRIQLNDKLIKSNKILNNENNFYFFNFTQLVHIIKLFNTCNYVDFFHGSFRLVPKFLQITRFLKEYLELDESDSNKRNIEVINHCFLNYFDFNWIFDEHIKNKDLSCIIRIEILNLLIAYLEEIKKKIDKKFFIKLYGFFDYIKIFKEIVLCFKKMFNDLKNPMDDDNKIKFKKFLLLYINDDKIYTNKYCLLAESYYKLLRNLNILFKDLKKFYEKYKISKKINKNKKSNSILGNLNLNSSSNDSKEVIIYDDLIENGEQFYDLLITLGKEIEIKYIIKISTKKDNGKKHKKELRPFFRTLYFFKSPKCFWINITYKKNFLQSVPRNSLGEKLNFLTNKFDTFLYLINIFFRFRPENRFISHFYKVDYGYYLELINYILILAINCWLLVFFTKTPEKEYIKSDMEQELENEIFMGKDKEYRKNKNPNLNTFVLFACFVEIIIYLIWFYFKFSIILFYSAFKSSKNHYLFKDYKNPKEFNDTSFINYENMKSKFNKINEFSIEEFNLNLYETIKVWIIALFFNKEMKFIVFSFVCNIVFLITNFHFLLIFPVISIINLYQLFNFFWKAMIKKYQEFIAILVFIYVVEYIFSWITFLFYQKSLIDEFIYFGDGLEETNYKELLCSSAFECFLNYIDLGLRLGGGIGEKIPRSSYKYKNKKGSNFYSRLLLITVFHILVNLILSNIFFGIIVDTFTDFRDENNRKMEDIKNYCYICNRNRYSFGKKGDFEEHRGQVHKIYNYVYFICYLFRKHPHEFSRAEEFAWSQINLKQMDWFPVELKDS